MSWSVNHPPASSTKVKERVQLHLYSPSRPSWLVTGRTLPLPFTYLHTLYIYHQLCMRLLKWNTIKSEVIYNSVSQSRKYVKSTLHITESKHTHTYIHNIQAIQTCHKECLHIRNVENDNCIGMINKCNASGSIQALCFYKRIISLFLYTFIRAYICRITGMCTINIQCKLNS